MNYTNISHFIRFEWQYRKGRPATYLFFLLMIIIGFAVSLGAQKLFNVAGLVKINAPVIIDQALGMSVALAMFIISAVVGVSVIRDYQHNTFPLFFTKPISKREYLIGRFIGSFSVILLLYLGVIIGMIIPELLQLNPNLSYNPFNPAVYLRALLFVALPEIFFLSALFFAGGALTKKTAFVYLQGFLAFVFFTIADESIEVIFSDPDSATLLDFFLIQSIAHKTEFWSIAERNSQFLTYNGALLLNRIILLVAGALILFFSVKRFKVLKTKKAKK